TKSSEAELTRCNPDWRTSFVAIHPESALDEKQYADIVIKHISSKPIYINANNDDAIRLVPYSVWMMDDIYNGIGISAYLVYKAMRNHNIYVTLDGHGADELLGGYPFYLDILYMNINNKLYDDFHSHLLPSILRNFDRCSMASGIEVRMPFMDWGLVTYTFSLPVDAKIGNGFTKRILRDAMNKIIPEQIRLRRSKIGLNSPMIEWFNNGLRPLIYKVINHKYWRNSPFWNAKKLNNIIIDYCQNQKWTYKDWNLILELWTKFNLVIYYILFCEKNKDYFNE
ncbi:MAG TPA: hypothetical protein DD709_05505, partial [Gammaproteobacteria bacterium]|nr:hypothetical protein [Gammaproteobacteria bacterium]